MEGSLVAYIPQDRRAALARGQDLPEHTRGAALFADISGFTPLTEALDHALGARRGVEELTRQINHVYDALIVEIERYGGSVIGFAGDSITCWFDDEKAKGQRQKAKENIPNRDRPFTFDLLPSARSAAACALALQAAMGQFAAVPLPDGSTTVLALKVAVACGAARRFAVGDPVIQRFDVLVGATIARMAAGEHVAVPGEVLIDESTAARLGDTIGITEWRQAGATSDRFAVLSQLQIVDFGLQIDPVDSQSTIYNLQSEIVRPWLPPAVYARYQAGLGNFLTELRPAVTLFLRFMGIDYDADPDAGARLDAFIRRVQQTLMPYEGALLQLTIGDKGSYFYAVFGALIAHEDDPRRAVDAALDLRAAAIAMGDLEPVQIGISHGTLLVGAYGSSTRQTYGVMGDDVNLAARLMSLAAPGEILVSARVQAAVGSAIALEPRPPIPLKGKAEPLPVFAVSGASRRRAIRLEEPSYTLPMVGRAAELALIADKLALALAGHGQVVGITAEAGMGKSRLLAEVIRLARRRGLQGYGGACQSYGTNTPYLVWGPVWRAFFDLDPSMPLRRQARALEGTIDDLVPERMEALPLLGPLLGLNLPENDFTQSLEPQFRQSALHALLLDCLGTAAREAGEDGGGLLLVLEDLHWIDAASHDLLEQVARAIVDLPILIVLAYRPPELLRLQTSRVEALSHFTRVSLAPLTDAEATQAIRAKLAQLWPERTGILTLALTARITGKAQGNPFYVEELLNYLRDRGIDPQDAMAIAKLELPSSLHTLILSRIDQLSAQQQVELRVASVIGRLFQFAWLHGAYPVLGKAARLKADLSELARLDLTPLDTPEPELTYLFKHIVTQEVAYESLTAGARTALHEQLAAFLEAQAGDDDSRFVELLAYHYERSDNRPKKRMYLRRAGEAAAARFANDAALAYLSRALDLAPEDDLAERWALLLAREKIYDLQGAREMQRKDLTALEALARTLDDHALQAEAALRWANHYQRTSDFDEVAAAARRAAALAEAAGATPLAMRAYYFLARAAGWRGEKGRGIEAAETALRMARDMGDRHWEALILLDRFEHLHDYTAARDLIEQVLRISRELADRQLELQVLDSLSGNAWERGDFATAQAGYEQTLRLAREIGDRERECVALGGLGLSAQSQGNLDEAWRYGEETLHLARIVGNKDMEGWAFSLLGGLAQQVGDYATARSYLDKYLNSRRALGLAGTEGNALGMLGDLMHEQGDDSAALDYGQEALRVAQRSGSRFNEAIAFSVMGRALIGLGRPAEAAANHLLALEIRRALGQPHWAADDLAGLARAALSQGNTVEAITHVEAILAHLEGGGSLDHGSRPLSIYLTCYRVLQAASDPRALAMLETAYTLLQERAARISDAAARRSFLENVLYHREIAAAWAEASGRMP
jgi:predicted ATPase/class 3 adenylate cyclase